MTLVILRALGLGDVLTAFPALRALAVAFPHHRRVLAMPRDLAPVAMLSGAIHEVLDARPLEAIRPAPTVDVAVNLHGRGPISHRVLLALRPARLIAFAHPAIPQTHGGPTWRADEHEVARWCRLLAEHGIASDPSRLDLDLPPGPVAREAVGATLLHPGAAHQARRWPADRWAAVARAELAAGRRVVLTGGAHEVSLTHDVATRAGLPASAVLAGTTDVVDLARLVKVAGRVACGDTGVAHLATALRTPSVVLFGPTAPSRWGPPSDRSIHRVLWTGRHGSPNAARVDPGLLRISPAAVIEALDDLTSNVRAAA